MEQLLHEIEHEKTIQPAVRMRWIRIVLATAAGLAFVGLALAHERPVVMLVGLAPLAMIAVEAVWRLFSDASDRVARE
jgi:hypothetical protein